MVAAPELNIVRVECVGHDEPWPAPYLDVIRKVVVVGVTVIEEMARGREQVPGVDTWGRTDSTTQPAADSSWPLIEATARSIWRRSSSRVIKKCSVQR